MSVILRNFLALSLGEIASKGFGFLALVYLARILGVESFGDLSFVLAIYSYLAILANQGFEIVGAKEIARTKEPHSLIVGQILPIRAAFAIIALLCSLVLSLTAIIPESVRFILFLQSLNLLILPFSLYFVFQGLQEMRVIGAARTIQAVVYLVLILLAVHSPEDVSRVPLLLLASTAVSFMIPLGLYVKRSGVVSFRLRTEDWGQLLKVSVSLGITSIMIQVYSNLDVVMLGFLREAEVGYYSAAYKIVLAIGSIVNPYMAAIFPTLARLYEVDRNSLGQFLFRVSRIVLLIAVPTVGLMGLYSMELMILLFGHEYSQGVLPLQILLITQIVIWIASPFAVPLVACNLANRFLLATTVGAGMNFMLNIFLIPRYSMTGAALATLLAEIVVGLIQYNYFTKLVLKISISKIATGPVFLTLSIVSVGSLLHTIMPFYPAFFSIIVLWLGGIAIGLKRLGSLSRFTVAS